MPTPKGTNVIDGYASVQAVRRAKDRHAPKPSPRPVTTPAAAPKPPRPRAHTVMPDKHEIICYECGYTFPLTGRIRDTYCSKCRAQLLVKDHTIEGEWSEPVRTIGRIEIADTGVLREGAELNARTVVVAGDVRQGTIRANDRLEIRAGAKLKPEQISARTLIIQPDGDLTLRGTLTCQDLEVAGRLTADIVAEGRVTIHPGGRLKGSLDASHLTVEEGASLVADLNIHP